MYTKHIKYCMIVFKNTKKTTAKNLHIRYAVREDIYDMPPCLVMRKN